MKHAETRVAAGRDPARRTCRRSGRSRGCARSSTGRRSGWPRRSRCCTATWHVDGQSVRPDHRMVAHTGFLTHARLLRPARVNFLDLVIVAAILGAAWAGYRLGIRDPGVVVGGPGRGRRLRGRLRRRRHAGSSAARTPRTRLHRRARVLPARLRHRSDARRSSAGSMLRRRLAFTATLHRADRILGGVLGGVGILVGVWLLTPALASAPGWTARAVRGSAIVREVDRVAPGTARLGRGARAPGRRRAVPRGVRAAHLLRRRTSAAAAACRPPSRRG